MSFSETSSQPHPEGTPEFVSARARRRRALRRAQFPTDEAGRAELFAHLVRRAFPSYELFVFSFVSGAILGLGYLFNAQALLIFGILVAPLLTPWIGTTLSIVAGALRLFLQTVMALFISALVIFLGGWLAARMALDRLLAVSLAVLTAGLAVLPHVASTWQVMHELERWMLVSIWVLASRVGWPAAVNWVCTPISW